MGEVPLNIDFRSLSLLAVDPKVSVADSFDTRRNVWVPRFRRDLNDWKMDEMIRLLCLLEGIRPDLNRADGLDWNLTKHGRFTSKSFYIQMVGPTFRSFPSRGTWILGIPTKISFFIWMAVLDKIITLDHLQRRWWNLANRCVLCLREEESVDHLFVHCALPHRVWGSFLSPLNISWSFPSHFYDLIAKWWIRGLARLHATIWSFLLGAICWGL